METDNNIPDKLGHSVPPMLSSVGGILNVRGVMAADFLRMAAVVPGKRSSSEELSRPGLPFFRFCSFTDSLSIPR
jgi:hypothetical protein